MSELGDTIPTFGEREATGQAEVSLSNWSALSSANLVRSGWEALVIVLVAVGVIGCLIGGVLSDRIGRTATTAGMMIVSGFCATTIG